MPRDLKDHIKKLPKASRKQVWVSCKVLKPSDHNAIEAIEYLSRGFPGYFYPFSNKKGYVSPLAAVRFVRPKCEFVCLFKRHNKMI